MKKRRAVALCALVLIAALLLSGCIKTHMLMCPERDKESVAVCEEAVKSGKVEDYVFFETSPEYLTSKLITMLPA